MTTFLASISPAGWVCIALGAYLILACIGSAGLCAVARWLKRKPKPKPEHVDWTLSLPPVPAPLDCRRCADADWLADQPTDVWLTDEVASRMCREILAIEGLSS